jgi:hypothetical protein
MTKKRQPQAPDAARQPGYTLQRKERSRFWEVLDPAGDWVCLTVYKRGAME